MNNERKPRFSICAVPWPGLSPGLGWASAGRPAAVRGHQRDF
ncbi:hypothetical protein QJS66_14590 [Kocuria rhizophila]|nr:hypothetical protein QJS66_14590 [Kocuria rhizophila]